MIFDSNLVGGILEETESLWDIELECDKEFSLNLGSNFKRI